MAHRFACADFTFPLLSHDQALKLIAMLGFEGVDIGLFEGRSHLWPSREFRKVEASARDLQQRLGELDLQAADIFLQMDPDFEPYAINHPEPERRQKARDWFRKTLDYAAGCDCRHVTTLPGIHFAAEPFDKSYARAVEELRWRVDQAHAANIIFGVEAHVGSLVPDPISAERLVQDVEGLTLTLDYTHFTRLGMPDADIEPLLPYASHFHVRGARDGRLQESYARNTIDYQRIYQVMQETGFDGWIGIEYVWIDWEHCNECDNLSETILFQDFLRTLSNQ